MEGSPHRRGKLRPAQQGGGDKPAGLSPPLPLIRSVAPGKWLPLSGLGPPICKTRGSLDGLKESAPAHV